MTKSVKHKKEFRKEKNKIKLKLSFKAEKSGKKKKGELLPKGLNVTDTSFKTRKIVLPDHMRLTEESGIPLSHRKQTYKELLSHMGHFNACVQQDGINGMKELLVKFPEVLEVSLSSLLGKLSELMAIRDAQVRKCSLKLLEYIIQSTSTEKITPFFPLLNAQLMCCMNHISLGIQKDSHLLLDILVTHVPALVSTVALQILPNFLEQISCRDDTKNGKRVLTINPNQRLTSLKWRQEVLTRVHRLLTLLLGKNQLDTQRNSAIISLGYRKTCPFYMKRNFDVKLNIHSPGQFSVNERSSHTLHLQEFISHLFPLLSETWVEALASEQLNKNQGYSLIGTESLVLFTCITNVMFTLWNIMNRSENNFELLRWFELEYGELLIRNFIHRFPFSARVETTRNKKQLVDPQCREQNLILCFLWAHLEMKSAAKYSTLVFQYLCGLFQSSDQYVFTAVELDKLKEIVLACCRKKHLKDLVDSLIDVVVEFCNCIRPDRKDRLYLNKILMTIGETVGDRQDISSLKRWIEECPSLVHDNANMDLLESINRVMSRNANCLANGRKEVSNLIAHLDKVDCKSEHWKAIFNYIYLTKKQASLNEADELDILKLREHIVQLQDSEVKSYGLGMLNIIGATT